jgi:hypothetical protein
MNNNTGGHNMNDNDPTAEAMQNRLDEIAATDDGRPFIPAISTDGIGTNRRVFAALDSQARALSGLAMIALDKGDHEGAAAYSADAAALVSLMTTLNDDFSILIQTATSEEMIRWII